MSSIPEPSPDSADQRARDTAATSVLVDQFLACRSGRAALEAREIRTLAAAAALVDEQRSRLTTADSRKSDLPARTMVAELAVAARVSERTIQRQLNDAADLCTRFAAVVDALAAGRISRGHVSVIHETGAAIDDDTARAQFISTVIARAETLTPGRLRPIAEVLAARLNPRSIEQRHAAARATFGVWVTDRPDGIADLLMTGSAVLVHGIYDRLTQHAHAVITAQPTPDAVTDADPADTDTKRGADAGLETENDDSEPDVDTAADTSTAADRVADTAAETPDIPRDTRTIDQVRADIFCDLLLTGTAETCTAGEGIDAIHAIVQVTVPALTAAAVDCEPALLARYGPIDPITARRLLGNTPGWERVITSPVTGNILAVDRYRSSNTMKRYLRARDEHCRFPGCRQPVWRCDLDHTIDAAHGGPTTTCNLAHLCKRHHILKHNSAWQVRQLDGGVLEWTSPTGRVYTDHPEPVLRFIPDPDPPTFRDPAKLPKYDPDHDPSPF